MATVRHRNFIIIFTMPYITDIIKKVRRLVHYTVECPGLKNYKKGYAYVKIMESVGNHKTGEIYDKYTRVQHGRVRYKVKWIRVWLPPKPIVTYYEIRKKEYTDKLYKDMEKAFTADASTLPDKELTPMEEAYYYIMCKYNPKSATDMVYMITQETGAQINTQKVSLLKKGVRGKGFIVGPKTDDYMARLQRNVAITQQQIKDKMIKEELEPKGGG